MSIDLSTRAILVAVRMGTWPGRRFDKKRRDELIAAANARSPIAVSVSKNLFPDNSHIKAINAKGQQVRQYFYSLSLPWAAEGLRVMPTPAYMDFLVGFGELQQEFDDTVTSFLVDYSRSVEAAKGALGGMFNDGDYPPVGDVRSKFYLRADTFPVPGNDFRVDLGADLSAELSANAEQRANEVWEGAVSSLWERLYTKVKHLTDILADHERNFRVESLIAIKEQCQLLTKLNVTDNRDLEAMREKVSELFGMHHPETLRNDPVVRRDVADEAFKMLNKMSRFIG